MGARGGRLDRIPVRRAPHAHARRAEPGRARHAGVRAAPVRPRAAQPRRAQAGRLHPGHAQPARRRNPARCRRRAHRHADRPAQRDDPVRDAGQGAEAAARIPGQLDAAVHARAQPPGRDQRHRRGRRLPELPGGLRRHPPAGAGEPADGAHRLQPLHAEAEGRAGRLQALDRQRAVPPGRRLPAPQRRGRDAGLLRRRF